MVQGSGACGVVLAQRVLTEDTLATLEGLLGEDNPTANNFTEALHAVTNHVFPPRALVSQKRAMRRFMRKPSTMKVRSYVTRLREINDLLPYFPPFGNNQKLPEEELKDYVEAGLPATWQKSELNNKSIIVMIKCGVKGI